MYIKLRNNKIIKTVILNLINDLNLELDKDGNILSRPCYLNINKSKLAIEKEWSPIYPNTVSSSENKIKDINIQKQCEECYKTFSSIKTYKLHIKTHKRRRQKTYYSCVHCDYKTLNKSSLQGHINKSHLKVRQFVCQVCFKSFYHKKNLTEHVRSHTKGRDEVCEICGETFLHRKNLLEHLRLHNNVRPYECNICSKRFITSGRRSDHIKRTHREKNEVCLLCDKRFSLPKELTRHIKSVHS
ncbi:zinc finger and BTB domain-containing protein 17 [Danaus plexippus plexippus]|uniref:Zinc finger and BTB domain-containing protein 17 n=1 Tax=Danaus plexippus plexippus TaxID=278856 RepID=A0A212EMV0_DANPL|nr:zinc finger and BTB domain-containing protein 17 [Danaus plexippus plexippus]